MDPLAVVGPAGVARALHAGLPMLDVVRRLGDSRCGGCRARGALFFDTHTFQRVCSRPGCPFPPGASVATCKPLINRFFFVSKHSPDAARVATEAELLAAIADADKVVSADE